MLAYLPLVIPLWIIGRVVYVYVERWWKKRRQRIYGNDGVRNDTQKLGKL